MDWFEGERNNYLQEHLRKWGPSPGKVTWTELCRTSSLAHPAMAEKISPRAPIFMSEQLTEINRSRGGSRDQRSLIGEILYTLRPEDAIQIPMLRVDEKGKIVDWNRSMCDLTGFSPTQMIGKNYNDVLNEWMPHLTKEYQQAAFDWLVSKDDVASVLTEEECRADYLFPLPLPLRYDASFEYISGQNRHCNDYIELLVAKAARFIEVYPTFDSSDGVPQYHITGMNRESSINWYFDTAGWVGGLEFTLRKKQFMPSLATLCRELLPDGGPLFNSDGSIANANMKSKEISSQKIDVYEVISDYIRSCDATGIKYIREVLNIVHDRLRKQRRETKVFKFTEDWSSNPKTSTINKYILIALGGKEIIEQRVVSDEMIWTTGTKEEIVVTTQR